MFVSHKVSVVIMKTVTGFYSDVPYCFLFEFNKKFGFNELGFTYLKLNGNFLVAFVETQMRQK